MNNPVAFRWVNGTMVCANTFHAARASKQFVEGQTYALVIHEARSPESHSHFFAALHEGWVNLAEEYADEFATPEYLRAWCLVKAGFADKQIIVCASPEDAGRTAAIASSREKIRIVIVEGCTVTIWVPKSMSMKAMGKAEFEASKRACLEIVASMARTTVDDLERNAGRSA